jgi:membrane-bound lytic murein transglycosylase F
MPVGSVRARPCRAERSGSNFMSCTVTPKAVGVKRVEHLQGVLSPVGCRCGRGWFEKAPRDPPALGSHRGRSRAERILRLLIANSSIGDWNNRMCTTPRSTSRHLVSLALLGLLFFSACERDRAPVDQPIARDWAEIQERDTIVFLTTYNSTSYFIYRGEPMGLEYELVTAFARDHDLAVRTVVNEDRSDLFNQLARGEGDILGARLVPQRDEHERIEFSQPLYETRPMLVQATGPPAQIDLPEPVDTLIGSGIAPPADERVEVRARRIADTGQLAEQIVHVSGHSAYVDRLIELSDSITGEIEVVEVDQVGDERLIRAVARGEVELVVAPEHLARLREEFFDNIAVTPAVGAEHPVSLGVRHNAPALLERLNAWLQENAALRDQLYQKYLIDRRGYHARVESEYLTTETGRLSEYDDLFRRNVGALGWDWRLLASLAYQESQFLPTARSWAGAQGLLQLMPGTARDLGVRNAYDPEENVAGGARFLVELTNRWTPLIADPEERLKFVLASYNVGPGHVDDARRLTEKHGGDTERWDQVAFWLLQKAKREVYTDPVVRHGFARGLEPVTYVSKILDRYDHYRQFVETVATAR